MGATAMFVDSIIKLAPNHFSLDPTVLLLHLLPPGRFLGYIFDALPTKIYFAKISKHLKH